MSFLNPAGLWGLLGIPVLIIIYIIKPKFQEKLVTSTFIWKLSQKYKKKSLPWQISNTLLFIVQLLTIGAISLILARPVIATEDGAAEKIVILDASASMMVEGTEGTRFETAKAQICDLADEMESYGKMTVIVAGMESRVLIERSDSEQKIKELVTSVECTYGEPALQEAFLMAEDILEANPAAVVYLFTDREYEESEEIKVVNVAEEAWNVAIHSLKADKEENQELMFLAELGSYGQDTAATVVLYVDGILADAQLVGLLADVPTTLEFTDLGIRGFEEARIYVEAADALYVDNEYYLLDGTQKEYDVLLVSEEPTFFEAALLTYDNMNITVVASLEELDLGLQRMADGSVIENIPSTGYDLYIYDNEMPKELPGDGAVWMICPEKVPKGVTFKLGDVVASEGYMEAAPDSGTDRFEALVKEVATNEVYINEYVEISSALGFEPVYVCKNAPVIFAGETENVRTMLFAFDLSDSNLPLRVAFPALIHNMMEYSLCTVLETTSYEVGDEVTLNQVNGAGLTTVMGNSAAVAENYVRMPVSFVAEVPGLYHVTQIMTDESSEEAEYFVSLSGQESNLTAPGGNLPEFEIAETEVNYEKEITWWFVAALLLLIVVEWGLQYREQF